MDNFEDRERALEFLRQQNEKQMAALPADLQEVLRSIPLHQQAKWLAEHGQDYQGKEAGEIKPVLTEEQQTAARLAHMTDDEYLALLEKHRPDLYNQALENGVPVQQDEGQPDNSLTEEESRIARMAGMTDEQYLSLKLKRGTPISQDRSSDGSDDVTEADREAARIAQDLGHKITPEQIRDRRLGNG